MAAKNIEADWHLVQFIEDKIWFVCPSARIRQEGHKTLAKWPTNGIWYSAKIYKSGDKKLMQQAKIIYESTTLETLETKTKSSDKTSLPKRSWRRMCNVGFNKELEADIPENFKSLANNNTCKETSKDIDQEVYATENIGTLTYSNENDFNHNENITIVKSQELSSRKSRRLSQKQESFSENNSVMPTITEAIAPVSINTATSEAQADLCQNVNGTDKCEAKSCRSSQKEESLSEIVSAMPAITEFIAPVTITTATLEGEANVSQCVNETFDREAESSNKSLTTLKNVPLNTNTTDEISFGSETESEPFHEEDSEYIASDLSDRGVSSDDECMPSKSNFNDHLEKKKNTSISATLENGSHHLKIKLREPLKESHESTIKKVETERNTNYVSSELLSFHTSHAANDNVEVSADSVQENILNLPLLPVATVLENPTSKKKCIKTFYCIYCKKSYAKLPRHLFKVHSSIPEVAKICSLEPKSKERKHLLGQIQNQGMFAANKDVIRSGEGTIITKRRPNLERNLNDYLPCTHCFQMLSKKYLARHQRNCSFKIKNDNAAVARSRSVQATSCSMLPVGVNVSNYFREAVLNQMIHDDIYTIIRSDHLILAYGQAELARIGCHKANSIKMIKDKCRELGRLLAAAKELDSSIVNLTQLLTPTKYILFRDSVFKVTAYDPENNIFQNPSLALKIGFSIKKVISTLIGEYLVDDILRIHVPQLKEFEGVIQARWSREISTHARRTLEERKWNNPKRMPLAKDIQKIHKYLLNQSLDLKTKLKTNSDQNVFKLLTEITLVQTIILNRRRVGEVQFMLLEEYEKCKGVNPESDVFQTLSEAEKELSKNLVRLVIRGKRGRGVPVLLNRDLQDSIELLIQNRVLCGIMPSNKYLFASLTHSSGYYRAHELLRKYARQSGCTDVNAITSTRLRKHVAVMSQLLNLRDNELDSLATFMGHDIRIHREYYRLADETVQLAKISKLLINMEKGSLDQMKGKNLDQIEVNDFIDTNEQLADSDNEDNPCQTFCQPIVTQPIQKPVVPMIPNAKIMVPKSLRRNVIKKPWSEIEVTTTLNHFRNYLDMKVLPGKKEIETFLKKHGTLLVDRKWTNIKDFLRNKMRKENE